jgi:SAM-dependent methyltransferase
LIDEIVQAALCYCLRQGERSMYVQYGCGHCAPEEWINFDISPTLRIERLPVIGHFIKKNAARFPANVRYGDIISGLPIPDGSVEGLYASHVLEHLSRHDLSIALRNSLRLLAPDGIFRLVVPDLEARAQAYLAAVHTGSPHASDLFMRSTNLGLEQKPRTILHRAAAFLGNSAHLWMWDYPSLSHELASAGFDGIRRCRFGDSGDPMFSLVEDRSRFIDGDLAELAIQAQRTLK